MGVEFLQRNVRLLGHCALFAFLTALSGCGYTFQGSGTSLPNDVKSIAIRAADNDTTSPGLGPKFTDKLRSRFERYGVVKIVGSGQEADAELITKITSIDTRVRDVTGQTDIALEYDVYMTISAELRRRNGQVLYKNPHLVTFESFGGTSGVVVTSSSAFVSSGVGTGTLGNLGQNQVSRGQQDEAIENLMDESARKLYLDAVAAEF